LGIGESRMLLRTNFLTSYMIGLESYFVALHQTH
jgi:hypothetical protein